MSRPSSVGGGGACAEFYRSALIESVSLANSSVIAGALYAVAAAACTLDTVKPRGLLRHFWLYTEGAAVYSLLCG